MKFCKCTTHLYASKWIILCYIFYVWYFQECERKETEFANSAADLRKKYSASCKQMGIEVSATSTFNTLQHMVFFSHCLSKWIEKWLQLWTEVISFAKMAWKTSGIRVDLVQSRTGKSWWLNPQNQCAGFHKVYSMQDLLQLWQARFYSTEWPHEVKQSQKQQEVNKKKYLHDFNTWCSLKNILTPELPTLMLLP